MKVLAIAASAAITGIAGELVAGTSDECYDLREECARWAAAGECARNLGFMRLFACRVSCGSCGLEVADTSPLDIVDQDFMSDESARADCGQRIPQGRLRWGADRQAASEVGCLQSELHEDKGAWLSTGLPKAAARVGARNGTITFYDTAGAIPLFVAPRGRTMAEFLHEAQELGWLSFRDAELVTANLRSLRATRGQVVSVLGTRLGVNRPGENACRYAINVATISGYPPFKGEQMHEELRQ